MNRLVFIIDDDPVYLEFMKGHFNKMGDYQVDVFPLGDDALTQLEKRNPYMIILDHQLLDAVKDGIYYLRKIKKIKPTVPIVYITVNKTEAVKHLALKNGAKCVIIKSESFLVQLRTAIDEIDNPPKKGIFSRLFK